MAKNFNKAERYVKQGDEYKLLSYATSSESVEMTDGESLQTKMDNIDVDLTSHTTDKSNPHEVTKTQVGLSNVDNTADADKPVSTATQTALNKKANLASPTLTGTPKAPTASTGTNTTQIATTAFVQTAVANLVDSAPETLNTLGELATAIEEHQDVTDALDAAISNKVDKVSGKGLSTNDYTTNEKNKLSATNVAYGTCATKAATVAKVITISGNTDWALKAGSVITVKFTYTNTASNPTFNVNNTGAKKVWYNTALITTTNLGFAGTANRPMNFVYDGTQYIFIGWSYDKDANTTYTNASLGQGYGTCATAASTTAKVVTLSSYALTTGGVVAVKFTYAVPANATMNVNSKGAKYIYYRGAKITAGIIEAGDTATFIYDGTQYHLLTIDKSDASFKELSYADYQAGNYDKTKNYAIPDYPHSNGTASQTSFDDTNAGLGADNVQGAIEALEQRGDIKLLASYSVAGGNPASSTTVTLGEGHKFSEYRYIFICMSLVAGFGSILNTQFMPVYMLGFSSTDRIYMNYDSTRYGSVTYKSDTTVSIACQPTVALYVYGLK